MTWFIKLQNRFNESRLFKTSTIYVLNWVDDLTSWHSLNAKSMTQFCKKHFIQLIKLIDIFCLIKILISCFNITWSKTSLTFSSKHVSMFSRLFVICASCTRFSTAFIADLCFLSFIWLKFSNLSFIFAVYDSCITISFFTILSKQFSSVIILYVFEIE